MPPTEADQAHQQGLAFEQCGDSSAALQAHQRALALDADHAAAHQACARLHEQLQQPQQALPHLLWLVQRGPEPIHHHNHLANLLLAQGQLLQALAHYDAALALGPHPFTLVNRGNALLQLQQPAAALESFEAALALAPQLAHGHTGCGHALLALHQPQQALQSYDTALRHDPTLREALLGRGNALMQLQRLPQALAAFDATLAAHANDPEALNNRGMALLALRRRDEALAAFDQALAANPDDNAMLLRRAMVLQQLRQHSAALPLLEQLCELEPERAEAHQQRGQALAALRRYREAAAAFERVLELQPRNAYALGSACDARMQACDWSDRSQRQRRLEELIRAGEIATTPFSLLGFNDDSALQLHLAHSFSARQHPAPAAPLWQGERYGHQRIRVAYLSADLRQHAVAYLIAELFERHDRDQFEIFGVSFCAEECNPIRERLRHVFDHFIDVADRDDESVARLLRQHEIDIAVDLNGYTTDCRTRIFTFRPAPVQVNYLGYPGTLALPQIDYILADPVVIPPGHECHYSETVVRLPEAYQPNDGWRPIAAETPSRRSCGLPTHGFVFCCFNNTYKISPEIFAIWMRLLRQVEGSVLWLLAMNAEVQANLSQAADDLGVDPARLVFGASLPLPEHLSRHRNADLFLDTLPYNAHTTCSDALWAGLPVLTCRGSAFPGRVAASLLQAIDLPELITGSPEAYEARALELARDPAQLQAIRRKLERHRLLKPLFDTERMARHVEAAFHHMHSRAEAALPPAPFDVPPLPPRQQPLLRQPEELEQARSLLDAGQPEQAIPLCHALLRRNPRDCAATVLLARIGWAQGNRRDAWKLLKSACFMAAADTTAQQLLEQLEAEMTADELAAARR